MHLRKVDSGDVRRVGLDHDRVQWRALVSAMLNLRVMLRNSTEHRTLDKLISSRMVKTFSTIYGKYVQENLPLDPSPGPVESSPHCTISFL